MYAAGVKGVILSLQLYGGVSRYFVISSAVCNSLNRRLVSFPQDGDHLLFGEAALLHVPLARGRKPSSQVTIGRKNMGRPTGDLGPL